MRTNYTIDEILIAVEEIQKTKREKNKNINQKKLTKIDDTSIPINTLKLIEEAEKKFIKNKKDL